LKITKEIKTAILAISSILLFIWGYSFLKGTNLLSSYKTLYVYYENVEGLANSAPITLNGLVIGKVNSITIDNASGKLKLELQIKSEFPISKTSVAEIYSPNPIGGKQISILPDYKNSQIAVDGDFLKPSNKLGLTDALAEQIQPLKVKVEKILEDADLMINNINEILDDKSKANLKNSLENINEILIEFKSASISVNSILTSNKEKINGTISNLNKVATNFTKISDSLAQIKIGKTIKELEKTLAKVDGIMTDLQSGKGTMGKILKDETLYNNFAKTSKELELLLQDLRLNPTRYVNVSLFGKKNKPYVAPVKDSIRFEKK
jgi:phospholipid/cholesterol/gamma-HCH transport system substrate-binding protein